jgi:hypothetical protein
VIAHLVQGGRVSPRSTAGASARTKHRQLVKSWHRRHFKVFVVLGIVCGLVMLGSYIAARTWPDAAWAYGLFGGMAMTFFTLVWISPPGWIENWEFGAWGEEATGKELARLDPARWTVIHDVSTGHGNVDHLVIGPGGVFVLDSKRLGGRVVVQGDEVRVERLDDDNLSYTHGGVASVRRLAAQTSQRMLDATRIKTWVTPVMVVWAEFPQRVAEGGCTVVHGDELVRWLESQPARIAPANVPRIAQAARSAWASAE